MSGFHKGVDLISFNLAEMFVVQGQHSCQSGTPLQGDQMPVRPSQDSVSGLGQKHGTTDHAVCAQQFRDGEESNVGRECMSPSKTVQKLSVRGEIA